MTKTRLAEWLDRKMREEDVKRNELARAADVSPGTITGIRRYGRIPGPDIVRALARYFREDADTVLEIAGHVTLSDVPAELPAEVKDWIRRLYRLPESDRKYVQDEIRHALEYAESRRVPESTTPEPKQ